MVLGYGIIAVPTGIVSAEYANQTKKVATNTTACKNCSFENHTDDAQFCSACGEKL
jgi:voltage-gated potassium channel